MFRSRRDNQDDYGWPWRLELEERWWEREKEDSREDEEKRLRTTTTTAAYNRALLSLALRCAFAGHTTASNRSQHLSNPDQANLSLFLSQTHHIRSQPLWLWFGLRVDELGALLGFYSLDGLVWEWFRWCGSGWFDLVVVLCWLLGFYSFAWV